MTQRIGCAFKPRNQLIVLRLDRFSPLRGLGLYQLTGLLEPLLQILQELFKSPFVFGLQPTEPLRDFALERTPRRLGAPAFRAKQLGVIYFGWNARTGDPIP